MALPDFAAMLADGSPATEAEATAALKTELAAQGSPIGNVSAQSPFFRLMAALFVLPYLWVRDWILTSVVKQCFLQYATGGFLDAHAWAHDETRIQPGKASGNISFTRAASAGPLTIPAGTVVATPPMGSAGTVYRLAVVADAVMPDGTASLDVLCQAQTAGAGHNLGGGYYSVLESPVGGITAVTNAAAWLTAPGTDLETDDNLRERCRLKFRRLTGWHTNDAYRSLVADKLLLAPGNIYFSTVPPRGGGSADILIHLDSGLASQALADTGTTWLMADGNHGLGDDVLVVPLPGQAVAFDLAITTPSWATAAQKTQLQTDVVNLIRCIFRENSLYDVPKITPRKLISRFLLASMIFEHFGEVSGLVENLVWTAPAADVVVADALPQISTLTVTVS